VVGTGGFGTVTAGWRIKDNLPVAIKIIKREEVHHWEDDKKIMPREIAILNRLSSVPRVIQLLDWYEDDDSFLLIFDRPEPCLDLFEYISLKKFIQENEAKKLFREAVSVASSMYESGIIHRDIKSENFLVFSDRSGKPSLKIIDFGAAGYVSTCASENVNGTPMYYPDEWFRLRKYHALPASVWSLGILLFDMTNGRLPFETKEEILCGIYDFERSIPLSEDLKELVRALLVPDPFERPSFDQILLHPWLSTNTNDSDRGSAGNSNSSSSSDF
ncbi:UNVERIFIED_CONTAM: hypothetical protein GTU68_032213, partial [Idotea baltica]|nr:hypothetical protein [Idotea baltica]